MEPLNRANYLIDWAIAHQEVVAGVWRLYVYCKPMVNCTGLKKGIHDTQTNVFP
jgi:hypothetical protein